MLGKSHLVLGSTAWLVAATTAPELLGRPSPAELGCGAVIAAGAACAPDLDCPNSSIARSLGPVSYVVSRVVAKLSLGHRQGTHSLLAVLLVALGVSAGAASSSRRFVELAVAFLAASLLYRVLLSARDSGRRGVSGGPCLPPRRRRDCGQPLRVELLLDGEVSRDAPDNVRRRLEQLGDGLAECALGALAVRGEHNTANRTQAQYDGHELGA